MSFTIEDHKASKRVRVIKFKEADLDRLIFPFKKHTILSLEYKPFSRFSLAKSLDEVFENKLSETFSYPALHKVVCLQQSTYVLMRVMLKKR